jgi:MEMO1 family protein
MEKIRKAAVAGQFYPDSVKKLNELIDEIKQRTEQDWVKVTPDQKIIGGITPHAGYVFSAWQAIPLYRSIKESCNRFETVVIINPNHRGLGKGSYNTSGYDAWETPYGLLRVDLEFEIHLGIEPCTGAHQTEHSGEVQLPLLQYFFKEPFKLVLITMNEPSPEAANQLAIKIKKAVDLTQRKIIVLASSDFSHYEHPESGYHKDQYVLDEILAMNPGGVAKAVKKHQVSVCGFGPVMALMEYSLLVAPDTGAILVKRGHSGEVVPSVQVVDYLSILFLGKATL